MTEAGPRASVAVALRRGAPSKGALARAVGAGACSQLGGVALVGTAAGLLTWAAQRPGIGAVAGLLVVVELIAFLRAPLRHAERLAAHDLGLGGLARWRTWLLASVATWAPSRLADATGGDLLARCLEDTDSLQDLWVRVVVPACASLLALVAAAAVIGVFVPLAGVAVAVAAAVVAVLTWSRVDRVVALGVHEAELRGTVSSRVVEFAHGVDALVLLGAERRHAGSTASLTRRCDEAAARRETVVSAVGVAASIAGAIAVLVAVAALDLPTRHAALDAGIVLSVVACGELLGGVASALDGIGRVAGAAARLDALADPVGVGTARAHSGALHLDKLDVAATSDGPVVLHAVTAHVDAGATVAIVGPSGSGKSTLLAVTAGLESPRAGTVSIDGTRITELDESSLRATLGWLPGVSTLLEGRVRDVLAMGRAIDDAALRRALHAVGLHDALDARGGLDAVIGPRGSDLSAGERRRLALARVLAGTCSVLVLDEPTAGLDEVAATTVLAAIDETAAAVLVASHDARVAAWAHEARYVVRGSLSETP